MDMTIAIDFDGTIVSNAFPAIGEPLPGAIETLRDLQAAGHRLVLWTCRANHRWDKSKHYLDQAVDWLKKHGIELAGSNECLLVDELEELPHSQFEHFKIFADLYIDDRNLGGFPGWAAVRRMLLCP